MYTLIYTPNFKKKFKKIFKNNKRLVKSFSKTIEILSKDPFYSSLKTHKVANTLFGIAYSSRITGDLRLLWNFTDKEEVILLLTVGNHDDVY